MELKAKKPKASPLISDKARNDRRPMKTIFSSKGIGDFSRIAKSPGIRSMSPQKVVSDPRSMKKRKKESRFLTSLCIPKEFMNVSTHSSNCQRTTMINEASTKHTEGRVPRDHFISLKQEPKSAQISPLRLKGLRKPNLKLQIDNAVTKIKQAQMNKMDEVLSAQLPRKHMTGQLGDDRNSQLDRFVSLDRQLLNSSQEILPPNNFGLDCLMQENTQLKKLNKKLVDNNCQLEEELKRLRQSERINNLLMQKDSSGSALKETEIKNSLKANFQTELRNLKRMHEEEIGKLKASFAQEIEQLQEVLADTNQNLTLLMKEKMQHGSTFIEILDGAKKKHQKLKTDYKHLNKKLLKLQGQYDKLASEHNTLSKAKAELDSKHENLEHAHSKNLEKVKALTKKLYKVEADEDLINLDPYELHRKIRYYEAQLDMKDNEFLKVYKDYKDTKTYLDILGITKKDLKLGASTGVLNIQNFNSKCFDLKYRMNSPKKLKKKHAKSSIGKNNGSSRSSSRTLNKREKFKRALKTSKSGIDVKDLDRKGAIEIDNFSDTTEEISANTMLLNPNSQSKEDDYLSARQCSGNSINDFASSRPTSNLDILKHLSKTKDRVEENSRNSSKPEDEESCDSSSDNDSFKMVSRKREYDQQIESSKMISNIII